MSFDTDWDIEKYKSPFESDEHWQLRKEFLLAHKEKYPEDQLICLAQVFFNIEFLGCRYPEETMKLVGELSEGIADSFREKKQNKIQRTFVKASDAAGAKIKGQSTTSIIDLPTSTPVMTASSLQNSNDTSRIPSTSSSTNLNNNTGNDNEKPTTPDLPNTIISHQVFDLRKIPKIENVIIMKTIEENFYDHGASILHRSLSRNNIILKYFFHRCGEKNEKWKCEIIIEKKLIAKCLAWNKMVAKRGAIQAFLQALQKICYTLEEKVKFLTDGSTVDKNLKEELEIPQSNEYSVANKMMKMMGWKGGGLGKTEQGISEPVAIQERVHRTGFGSNLTDAEVIIKIKQKLKTYAESDTNYDLLFSNDFTKDERSRLHSIAQSLHLKSRSYGSGSNRHLVVSKKNVNQSMLIENLKKCGGENERHRLISPMNF